MSTTYTWINNTTGDWSNAADWSAGVVPTSTTNATIAGSAAETVTVSTNQAVDGLTLDDANATLAVTGGATLAVYGGLVDSAVAGIDVANGTLQFENSQTVDDATLTLGSSAAQGTLTFDPAAPATAVLTLGPNLVVTATNGAIASGFSAGDGVVNQGTVTVSGSLSLAGDAVTNQGAIIGSGDLTVTPLEAFTNATGATLSVGTLAITDDFGSFTNNGAITAGSLDLHDEYGSSVTNSGTITADGSGESGLIYSGTSFDNTGNINVSNGDTLSLDTYGANNINNGTISVGAASRLIVSGTLAGTGSMVITNGGTLEVANSATPTATATKYAPPTMVDPTIIDLATANGQNWWSFSATQDVIFIDSSTTPITTKIQTQGGHNIEVLGGTFNNTEPGSTGTLAFYGLTGTAYVDGVSINNAGVSGTDGIDIAGGADTSLIVQNSNIVNINGALNGGQSSGGNGHADGIQTQGEVGGVIDLYNVNITTNYEGLFLAPQYAINPTSINLTNVSMSYTAQQSNDGDKYTYLLWMNDDPTSETPTTQWNFNNVYVAPRTGQDAGNYAVWPTVSSGYATENNGQITFNNLDATGAVTIGTPTTPFVNTSQIGGNFNADAAIIAADTNGSPLAAAGSLSDGVTFSGLGTLQLDSPTLLTGTITGLAAGDIIDFAHETVTNAAVTGTTLAVTFTGGQTENISLAAALPTGDGVQTSSDGNGGSDVVVTAPTQTPSPTVTVSIGRNDVNLANNTATVTFAFSAAPASFTSADITAIGGTLSNLQQVTPSEYTATFTAAAATDISTASVSVTAGSWQAGGVAGSGGGTGPFTVDTVTPTVAVTINSSTVTTTATVTFTFSEAPTSFTLSDTTAVGGTLSNLKQVDATHYTATFTAAANTDITTAAVSVTGGSWQEANGNAGSGASTANFTVNTMDLWSKATSGNWTTAARWSNGVPTAAIGADINASGTYTVTLSSADTAFGLTVNDAGATVTDNSGGTLTLAGTGSAASPTGVLTITAGTFTLNGGALKAGAVTLGSGGKLLVTRGSNTLAAAISGSGGIEVENNASLVISGTVTGTGALTLANGANLELAGADSENVTFLAGATGTLKLDHTSSFSGTVAGLTTRDKLDLTDLAWKSGHMTASFSGTSSGGTLTVSNGSQTDKIQLSGNYLKSGWSLSRDSNGNTIVVDPPLTAPASPANAALSLDNDTSFAGTVAGLAGLGVSPSFGSANTPTVSDGAPMANIALLGHYLAQTFAASQDGPHDGGLVVGLPHTPPADALAAPVRGGE